MGISCIHCMSAQHYTISLADNYDGTLLLLNISNAIESVK